MSKPKNQNDIVNEFLQKQDRGPMEEEVSLMGLKGKFEELPPNAKVQSVQVKVGALDRLAYKGREEIAETLLSIVHNRPDVCGFKWELGQNYVELRYVEGFLQWQPENDAEFGQLVHTLTTALKLRGNITAIDWSLGSDYLTLTHQW